MAEMLLKPKMPISQLEVSLYDIDPNVLCTDNTESIGYSWRILGCGHVICDQCVAALLRPLFSIGGDWHNLVK